MWQKICFHDLLSSPFVFLSAINKQCKWYIFLNCSSLSHARDRREGVWGCRQNPSTAWDRTTEKTNTEDGVFWGSGCLQEQDKDKCFLLSIPANVISLSKASCSLWHIRNWKTVETPVESKALRKGVEGGRTLAQLFTTWYVLKTDQRGDYYSHLRSETHPWSSCEKYIPKFFWEVLQRPQLFCDWVWLPRHEVFCYQSIRNQTSKCEVGRIANKCVYVAVCCTAMTGKERLYKVRSLSSWIARSGNMQLLVVLYLWKSGNRNTALLKHISPKRIFQNYSSRLFGYLLFLRYISTVQLCLSTSLPLKPNSQLVHTCLKKKKKVNWKTQRDSQSLIGKLGKFSFQH